MLIALLAGVAPGPADTAEAEAGERPPLHVVFVVDITGSWSQPNMGNLRTGVVAALDEQVARSTEGDTAALVTFSGRYAWMHSPWFALSDPTAVAEARASWSALSVASQGGTPRPFPSECAVNADSPRGASSAANQFEAPYAEGGCYPNMPRAYTDEPGTDQTTGLTLAAQAFASAPAGDRAVLLLTDGIPNGLASTNGEYRVALGYTETRWEEYRGPVPHSVTQIKAESPEISARLYATQGVDPWVVSFATSDPFLDATRTGRGTSQTLSSSEDFSIVLPEIIRAY